MDMKSVEILVTYLSIKRIKIQLKIARKQFLKFPLIGDRVSTSLIVGYLLQLVQGGLGVVGHPCHSQRRL